MGIGAMWEIFEFAIDQSFGFHMQYNSLSDTMWDLVATLIGAIVLGLIGIKYLAGEKYTMMDRLLRKMVQAQERRKSKVASGLSGATPEPATAQDATPQAVREQALPFKMPTRSLREKGRKVSSRRTRS